MSETSSENYIEANGLRFACRRGGDPEAPAIILIRGLGTQLIEWSPVLLSALQDAGLQTIIFDNRDVGLSSKLDEPYALDDMAADVVAILDALGIERAHVFGISLGGMVAQLVGHRYPARVRCLFSVMSTSGAPGLPTASKAVREQMVETSGSREDVIAQNTASRQLFGSPGFPESEAVRREMATRIYDRCFYPQGVARQMQAAIADGSRVDRLRQIRLPTLVIHGADDPLIPVACGEDTAAHIPGAQLRVIPGMGHNLPDALAPQIADLVTGFRENSASG